MPRSIHSRGEPPRTEAAGLLVTAELFMVDLPEPYLVSVKIGFLANLVNGKMIQLCSRNDHSPQPQQGCSAVPSRRFPGPRWRRRPGDRRCRPAAVSLRTSPAAPGSPCRPRPPLRRQGRPADRFADGFRRLAATLGEAYQATGSFLEVGVAYVRFAVTHRAHFEVMFRPELYRTDDPELVRAREQARALLYPPAAEAANTPDSGGDMRAGVAAWSLVHGLATLWLNHNLPPQLGDDPGADHPLAVAHYSF